MFLNVIISEILEFFSGDLSRNDLFFCIQTKDDEYKIAVRIPDEVVIAVRDCLRTNNVEMIPESILLSSFNANRDDKFVIVAAKPEFVVKANRSDESLIHDTLSPGKSISRAIMKYLLRTFRAARLNK